MFGIGMPEMLLLLAIALVVIGPKKLPDLARSLGRAMREFKKATNELKDTMQIDTELQDVKKAFNDISDDVKESIEPAVEPNKEADKPDQPQKAEADQQEDDGDFDNLKNLKQAFDNLDAPSEPTDLDGAPAADQDPTDKTKGPDNNA
jgi:TatA/E family protein of Tat protein translocase